MVGSGGIEGNCHRPSRKILAASSGRIIDVQGVCSTGKGPGDRLPLRNGHAVRGKGKSASDPNHDRGLGPKACAMKA